MVKDVSQLFDISQRFKGVGRMQNSKETDTAEPDAGFDR